jgi:hypothetical protein
MASYDVESGIHQSLAVGEERDTRDGHYSYHKLTRCTLKPVGPRFETAWLQRLEINCDEVHSRFNLIFNLGHYFKDESFTLGPALSCGNLTGVHRWLRDLCVGGSGGAAGGYGGDGGGGAKGKAKGKGGGRGGGGAGRGGFGGGGGFANGGANGGGGDDGAANKRQRIGGDCFASGHTGDEVDPPTRALRAEEREVRWTAARRAALAYVREDLQPRDAAELHRVQGILDSFSTTSSPTSAAAAAAADADNATVPPTSMVNRVIEAGRCRLTLSNPVLKAPTV